MATKLLRVLHRHSIQRILQSPVSTLTCQCQVRQLSKNRSQLELTTFPSIERIPVRYSAEIDYVLDSNWDKIEKFSAILKCKPDIVERLVRGDTRLLTAYNEETVCTKLKLLRDYKYTPEEISMSPGVFCLNTSELERRLAKMETVREYQSSLYLARIAKSIFNKKIAEYKHEMSIIGDHPSKLHFVAEKLDCKLSDVLDMINNGHTHLFTRPPSAINSLVDVIQDHGFTIEDIKKVPKVLVVSIPVAKKRFEMVKKSGVLGKISLSSVLVTNSNHFRVAVRNTLTELSFLDGSSNLVDIFKKRLGASEQDVKLMYGRATNLRKLKAKKVQPCLDILLNEMRIDPEHIIRKATVLFYSQERLEKRWKILQQADITDSWDKIRNLALNNEKFNEKFSDLLLKQQEEEKDKQNE